MSDASNRQVLVTVNCEWMSPSSLSACIMTTMQVSIYWSQMEHYPNIKEYWMLVATYIMSKYTVGNGNLGIKSQFWTKFESTSVLPCEDGTWQCIWYFFKCLFMKCTHIIIRQGSCRLYGLSLSIVTISFFLKVLTELEYYQWYRLLFDLCIDTKAWLAIASCDLRIWTHFVWNLLVRCAFLGLVRLQLHTFLAIMQDMKITMLFPLV